MKTTYFLVLTAFFCTFSPIISAETIYVDVAADGDNNGTSWDDAYTTIQAAIDNSLEGYEIIVAEGFYAENLDMDGAEVMLRSTDPNDPNVVAATILDGDAAGSVILCESGETVDTVIAGFWIQNGNGNSSGNGGGIACKNSSPVIKQCVFIDNTATGSFGGGIFCYGASPSIMNCKFIGNSSTNQGGGIACYQSNATITNCLFTGNDTVRGGGVACYQSDPEITSCSFSGNTADFGGAVYCFDNSDPVMTNSILWGDSASSDGDEVYNASSSSPTVNYCIIEGGWAGSGSDNLDTDPLFIDADGADDIAGTADDDLYLDGFSPCINTGDAAGDYTGQKDVSGYDRVLYGRTDIGAYEVYPIGGDLYADGQVDVTDLMVFADEMWLAGADFVDFSQFAGQWMIGVE